ncbi:MAG: hypothetical protein J6O62_01525 [Bacilli bacterium]|nr:hypothetical protein [Bacilli bacterium]
MSYFNLQEKLKELKNEEIIWIIYIGIIVLSFYSNFLERKYYIYNDILSKDKYRKIMIFIFLILIIVYYYFLKDSYDSYKNLKENDSKEKKQLVTLSFIASSFIFISGIIFLYIAIKDQNMDVELAFN